MIKKNLREKYRAARLSVDVGYTEERSLLICQNIFGEIDWGKIRKICAYRAIPELKEVDITPLLQAVGYKFPEIKITVLSQSIDQKLPKNKFDLVLVPCLAFDDDNHRLGWGGGFFDRFLAAQPKALKVGVAYQDSFVAKGLPREPHDIPLDMIITERKAVLRAKGRSAKYKAIQS